MEDSTSEDHALESRSSSVEGIPGSERCLSGDSLTEWRSLEQVENGNPSTSPSYWEIDDDDPGPRPSDLYGKFTWKIEGFSQVNKRELRSNIFEVGGYKWYILIYPQGCDVCNHLSLFLCVANHDKLLPGWSHFAQFTIAVVNNDSKKSKYSDTLHRFWKKEHDWGWKKFMELSKVSDGFIVDDALVIKAQVQVIREKAHQPFRCLDCEYRRELVRVYLSNVEKLCRRYVEEKRGKFIKIIEDKVRWSSFHAFWVGIDCHTRRQMSCEKSETVLKVVVKHFFIENEVTSTLVMDYLYSGMKALERQTKSKNGGPKLAEIEEMPEPFVYVEKDVFVLTNDVLLVMERAALEPLPPKDDKGSQNQNRLKEFNTGDDLESIELDERRLTELGRRTVEMFALNHIYSMIEIAYQEAVALRRQEELIREEEAAGQVESELRARRIASEKEKRSKKKQMKQKKNSRKSKDKGRSEKTELSIERIEEEIEIISSEALENRTQNSEMNQPESEERERETRPTSWDTDARSVEPEQSQTERKSSTLGDDSSSTCSNDSVLSTKGVSSFSLVSSSRNRRKNQQSDLRNEFEALDSSVKRVDQHLVKEEAVVLERKLNSSSPLPRRSTQTADSQITTVDPAIMTTPATSLTIRDSSSGSKSQTEKPLTPPVKSTKSMVNTKSVVITAQSRPFSAPLAPKQRPLLMPLSSPRPQTTPVLSRSMSAAGRIGVDPSQSTVNPAQSYRNAIMGRAASISATMSTSGTVATEQFLPKPELTFGSVTPEKLQSSALTQTPDDSPPSTRWYHMEEDSATSSGQQLQAQGLTQDEFPHLDIINDLLNEEYSQREVGANGYTPLSYSTSNEHYFFPGSASSAAMAASSGDDTYLFTMGSQLYEQMLLRESGSFGQAAQRSQPFDLSSAAYSNGPVQKQWPVGPTRPRPSDNNFYYDQDYLDMVRVMNGFNGKYHPSNGH